MVDKNCKQMLAANYPERMKEMRLLNRLSKTDTEKYQDKYNEIVLSCEYNYMFKSNLLLLSWGGPADGFLFSKDGLKVKYYFQDWGDYAEKKLSGQDLKTMQELFNNLVFIR